MRRWRADYDQEFEQAQHEQVPLSLFTHALIIQCLMGAVSAYYKMRSDYKERLFICNMRCSAGGLIMARGLGNQNMKKYHMWNLSHQDISNKVSIT